MAYNSRPQSLDGFTPYLSRQDLLFRQQLGADLLTYLAEPTNSVQCEDIGQFIDDLVPWMQSMNHKVSSTGIEVLTYLADRLGSDFRPYIQTVLPHAVDRLGDAKDSVREKAQLLLLKLLERGAVQPQQLLDKLRPHFQHKNGKVREEVLRCLVNTLNEYGTNSLSLSKFIPDIAGLLSDPTPSVRDTAFNTLVELYRHVGERLRIDLQRKQLVPASKWSALTARFDEAKLAEELLPTAVKNVGDAVGLDDVDRIAMPKPAVPVKKPTLGSAVKQKLSATPSSANSAGAMDEDYFISSFEDCPTVQIFSLREATEQLKTIHDIISDSNKEWNRRVDALKRIRSLIIAGALNYEEFYTVIRNLDIPLQGTLKDLRSQVVREACVTISYLSQCLGNRFEKTAEVLLQQLINLIQNSAKVMATSGLIAVRFIIQYTHSSRLTPIITNNAIKSKSKEIRKACCEFVEYILGNWTKHSLERHNGALQEAVKNGIADADPEARQCSRRAFKSFKEHFPEQAETLLQSLDPAYKRALQGESMSASSSQSNIAGSLKMSRTYGRSAVTSASDSGRRGFRSNSAIDLQAAQRAKARAQYSAMARSKIQSGTASLQGEVAQQARPRKLSDQMASPERTSRTRSRNSQSQPTSRSGSPSSRLAYIYQRNTGDHDSPRTRRLPSGIPRSTTGSRDGSRETSPTRGPMSRFRKGSGSGERPPLNPASRPVLAQKILQQSREAENALADVLNSSDHFRTPRRAMRSMDNHSDESETSSVCSERSSDRSFDNFKRPSDSYSWSGSQQRLASRDLWEPSRDINQIIAMCASTTWQERKDGLLSLQYYMANEIPLTVGELKHLTEIFTKMFMDSHTKGLGVFLDTLHEVIKSYKHELHSWLYVLLQRVFLKIGTETLTSIQHKLLATLDLIRSSFPMPALFAATYRFLVDATQTPNARVKVTALNFISQLCNGGGEEAAQHIATAPSAGQALMKIVTYAQDAKSAETRAAARACIVAMWNCNTSQITMLLAELPTEAQEVASAAVRGHMRAAQGGAAGDEPGSPLVSTGATASSPRGAGGSPGYRDVIDHEEVYRNLRRTTAEIQNYSFEIGSKLDRDTASQDSGISQMSVGNDIGREITSLEDRMEDLAIKTHFNIRSGSRSLPYTAVNGVPEASSNGFRSLGDNEDSEQIVLNILDSCLVNNTTPSEEKRKLLLHLNELIIKSGHIEPVKKHFKKILKLLIENLNNGDPVIRIPVLQILRSIFKCQQLKDHWTSFVELLTLRILDAHCIDKREGDHHSKESIMVVKEAEETAAAMSIGPFNTLVEILAPQIRTLSYPSLLGAIKMLTKLIEHNPKEVTDEHLRQIMPGLIKGTDHNESSVRKSSIFCMVAIHKAVSEERMEPYIKLLSGSKLKLLRLYISRLELQTPMPSSPTSPKNNTTTAS
ncbi:unnamed protein product [Acanthoscelides obtectus]|uniref:TOG domain-containing protein n=1 Tax=Acanthoscelides obtectus TaxID=200917 RepID=A0A9P0KXD3_ACAOB|nr:unnamed protein product [Acanthoscelides obtectus]CAK1681593.1 CLIP-associating protein 1 [Acanthoscelides obtectus]